MQLDVLPRIAAASIMIAAAASTVQAQDHAKLRGTIAIDGSSTVYPITEAIAEAFREVAPKVRITVGISGTGGGFKRFTVGETDISDASRPIKKKELEQSDGNGVQFVEIPVAYDGLSIVVNTGNYWVEQLTIDDLKKIFLEGSSIKSWKDLRQDWPDVKIDIYSPGTDSGTFDYFKEIVAGKKGAIRSDMSVSEDDNVLVRGVAGDQGGIGFFGCAYYFENKDKLKVVPIVNPKTGKAVTPTPKTIESGVYAPFSRPLFIYVNTKSLRKRHVKAFVGFYLEHAAELAAEVGYVRLPQSIYDLAAERVRAKQHGTMFLDEQGEKKSGPLVSVYR